LEVIVVVVVVVGVPAMEEGRDDRGSDMRAPKGGEEELDALKEL